jgi:hypothetical protein
MNGEVLFLIHKRFEPLGQGLPVLLDPLLDYFGAVAHCPRWLYTCWTIAGDV